MGTDSSRVGVEKKAVWFRWLTAALPSAMGVPVRASGSKTMPRSSAKTPPSDVTRSAQATRDACFVGIV